VRAMRQTLGLIETAAFDRGLGLRDGVVVR
jgi:hypothetical protein